MMRISLDSPALIAVRCWLGGVAGQQPERGGRGRRRNSARVNYRGEQLEPRMMLDAGMLAKLPDLVAASDTGPSNRDNVTSDRTPTLTGRVVGDVSQVRLIIDGRRAATVPVVSGGWNYTVPAEAALSAGKHTILARPVDASGTAGVRSKPLSVTVQTAKPTTSTLSMGKHSDSGVKGDGKTTYATPTLRGVGQPNQFVIISIDDMPVGRVKSDAKTGAWSFKAPPLANGAHDVTAVVENQAGLRSAATNFQVTVNGKRTVMLDGSDGNPVELMASHLLGSNTQGFIVTQVQKGTLQRWSAAKNAWVKIPAKPFTSLDPASLQNAPAIRKIAFNEVVRWTPAVGDAGIGQAFSIVPMDTAGGPTAPPPPAGTVPGKVVDAVVGGWEQGLGNTITWKDPAD
ncbi:MAG: hypothetical protein FJ275_12240, partial [Planctomycetes bacterium]|nr:hypothetical protein [Planctomycetota bacterium]